MRRSLANAKGFEAVENGWYRGTLEQVSVGETSEQAKNPGKPQLKIQFKITEGEAANRVVFDNLMLDEEIKGADRTKKKLEQLGHDPDDFDDEEVAAALTGVDCWAHIKKRKNSKEYAESSGDEYGNSVAGYSLTDPEQLGEEAAAEATADDAEEEEEKPTKVAKPAPKNGTKALAKPATKGKPATRARA